MNGLGYYVPSRQNDPPKLLLWDIDEAAVVLLPLVGLPVIAGMSIGIFVASLFLTLVSRSLYLKMKVGRGPAYALHMLYWHTPSALYRLKRTPPSHIREYAG